ncbi:hypothetical protein BO443_140173 [Burkholderia orbicola]
MQRVLIIWTGFDKFKKGNQRNFRGGDAAGKTHENSKKPFQNNTLSSAATPADGPVRPAPLIQPRLDTG